jgi:hypothetical protein
MTMIAMNSQKKLEAEVSSWRQISVHSHRFGGREFRLGDAEVGHVHVGGVVDIPFPRALRDALLAQGLAEEHRWVPKSGWITFRIRNDQDLKHATWLLRLSYLRYALKSASDPNELLERESEELRLDPRLKSVVGQMILRGVGVSRSAADPQVHSG